MEIKTIVTILFLSMLGLSLGANASTISSDEPWVDATEGITGGSTAITWFPANQKSSSSSTLDHAQTIIEVYTATWCETCIPAEEALNASITDHAVKVVKYHRHLFETEDPFGNNNTEGRWLSRYGPSAVQADFNARTPPTVIFGGERMHIGSHPTAGVSLEEEYSISLNSIMRPPISNSSEFTFTWEDGTFEWSWNWEEDITACRSNCDTVSTELYMMIVEDTAFFPEGSNGEEYYHRILRDVIPLGNNSIEYILPQAWDDDDVSIMIVLDWQESQSEETFLEVIPSLAVELVIIGLVFTAFITPTEAEKRRVQ